MLAVDDHGGLRKEVTHVLIDPFHARRAVMMVRRGDERDGPAGLRLRYCRIVARDLQHHRDAASIVEGALEHPVGMRHDATVLVGRAGKRTPEIPGLIPALPPDESPHA